MLAVLKWSRYDERMRRASLSGRYIVILAGIVILVFMVLEFNNRTAELRRLTEQEKRLATQVTSLQLTNSYLDEQIAYATSQVPVKKWAYEDARWIQPGEGDHLIIPMAPSDETQETSSPPSTAIQPVENWQVWMALFFDQDVP